MYEEELLSFIGGGGGGGGGRVKKNRTRFTISGSRAWSVIRRPLYWEAFGISNTVNHIIM